MSIAGGLGSLVILFFILGPLVTGIVLLVMSRRGRVGHPACGQCGYDVTSSVGTVDRCPECGTMFVESGVVAPSKSKRPVMFGIGLALVIVSSTCIGLSFVGAFFGATRSTTIAPAPPPPGPGPAPAPAPAPAEETDVVTEPPDAQ